MTQKTGSLSTGLCTLTVVKGPDTGKSFELEPNHEYLVGRAEECHIRIDPADKMVSRRHVLLKTKAGANNVVLENLSQTNPAQIKGKPVTGTVLKPGDRFQVGGTVFVFKGPAGSAASPPSGNRSKLLLLAGLIGLSLFMLVVIFSGGKTTDKQPPPLTRPGQPTFSDLTSPPPAVDKPSSLPAISGMNISEKDKQMADEHYRQGLFFYDTGNILKAVGEWERAISLNPDHADARLWFLKAEKELAEAVKNHYQNAMVHYRYMRYDQAAYEFKMVIELSRDKNSDQYINALRYLDELRNK